MKLKKLFSVLLLLVLCLTLPVACGDDESSYTSYVRMDFELPDDCAPIIDNVMAILRGFQLLEEAFPDFVEADI